MNKSAFLCACAAAAGAAAVFVACESSAPVATVIDQKPKNVPAAPTPDKGVQFTGPKLTLQAGEEKMLCWVPKWSPDKDYMVRKFIGFQGSMGHHVVALQNDNGSYKQGDQFDCTSVAQMVNIRPLVLPDPDAHSTKPMLEEGYAVKMKKGTTIVFQSHYINYGSKPIEIEDVARIEYATEANPIEVSYLIHNDGTIKLPAKQKTTRSMDCKVPQDVKLMATQGHMHGLGTAITIDLIKPPEAKLDAKNLFTIEQWKPEFRDAGPVTIFGTGPKSLDLKAGDVLRVNCTWNNTTDKDILFPKEMCATVSYYYPAIKNDSDGMIICSQE